MRKKSVGEPPVVNSDGKAYQLIRPIIENCDREHFIALLLDNQYHLNAICTISIGNAVAATVFPREAFKAAILYNASYVIFAHNHTSGDVMPSDNDLALTQRLIDSGNILVIPVLDHIIVGKDKYISLKGNKDALNLRW